MTFLNQKYYMHILAFLLVGKMVLYIRSLNVDSKILCLFPERFRNIKIAVINLISDYKDLLSHEFFL